MKVLFALCLSLVGATTLTKDNWESATAGKTVFVKFQAPWCGHCKGMKADWEKLMTEFKGSASGLVGDVDCTGDGQTLCQREGVSTYPTLKVGDPKDLQKYEGGRSYADLKSFSDSLFGASCGPGDLDLCDDAQKSSIVKFSAMSASELDDFIKDRMDKLAEIEATFKREIKVMETNAEEVVAAHGAASPEFQALAKQLQKEDGEMRQKKRADEGEVKSTGLSLAQEVKKYAEAMAAETPAAKAKKAGEIAAAAHRRVEDLERQLKEAQETALRLDEVAAKAKAEGKSEL